MRVSFLAAVFAAGCGLISSDVTEVTLTLPPRDFRIDTSDWQLPPGNVPIVPCAGDCTALAATVCAQQNCTAECGTDNVCFARIPISLKNDFNLAQDAPSYQQVSSLPAVSVTVESVTFNITENTLNLDTPDLSVYFGPTSVTSPSDPAAELVGSVPAVLAGTTGQVAVVFSPTGRDIIKRYMDDFHTPFRVLVHANVAVQGGQPAPAGRMVGQVVAVAKAGLSL